MFSTSLLSYIPSVSFTAPSFTSVRCTYSNGVCSYALNQDNFETANLLEGGWNTIVTGYTGSITLSLGDFDNDGDLDFVLARNSAYISFFRNNLNGGSVSFSHVGSNYVTVAARGVRVADINMDGHMDVFMVRDVYSFVLLDMAC